MRIPNRTKNCQILNVRIAGVSMKALINILTERLPELSGNYICCANVHTVVTGYRDDKYRAAQNDAFMTIPDGAPVAFLARKCGCNCAERTTGPDLMREIFIRSQEKGYKHFFVGATPETLTKLRENLEREYYGINIVGMFSPPFRKMTADEDAALIRAINDADPDFVWIGLGAPKQELWMYEHQEKVHGLMVGVGAGFNFYAGTVKRAPLWMQNHSLEWLYRLIQEPKRLAPRYISTNWAFIWNAIILKKRGMWHIKGERTSE